MTIPVKWFHANMTGAPQLANTGGSIIQILDACLINGFNVQSMDNLTYDSSTGTCTATVAAGHGFEDYQVVLVEGAVESGFNGEVRVTVVDATTFTYTPTTPPTSVTATGTIVAKTAPVGGWEKTFAGTNKAVYASTDPLAAPGYLRIDDNNYGSYPRIHGCRFATAVDTYNDPYPVEIRKWWANDGDFWALVADSRTFYFVDADNANWSIICAFGDFDSYQIADADRKFIAGGKISNGSWLTLIETGDSVGGDVNLQADYLGVADCSARVSGNGVSVPWGTGGTGVDPVYGEIVLNSDLLIRESVSGAIRGKLRGAYQPLHAAGDPGYFAVINVGGRLFASMRDKAYNGVVFVDLEGPW